MWAVVWLGSPAKFNKGVFGYIMAKETEGVGKNTFFHQHSTGIFERNPMVGFSCCLFLQIKAAFRLFVGFAQVLEIWIGCGHFKVSIELGSY